MADVHSVERQAKLVEQARLADARLPADRDDLAAGLANALEAAPQHCHLVLTPDEEPAGHRPGRWAFGVQEQAGTAALLHWVTEMEARLQRVGQRLANQNLRIVREAHQSLEIVPDLSSGCHVYVHAVICDAQHRVYPVKSQPHRGRAGIRLARLGAEVPDRHRRVGGPSRSVFREVEAKYSHHADRADAIDDAAEAEYLLTSFLEHGMPTMLTVVGGRDQYQAETRDASTLPANSPRRHRRGRLLGRRLAQFHMSHSVLA